MKQPLFELIVFPACLDCRWRELETSEVYGPDCTRYVTECRKLPVCRYTDGQEKITAERGK